MDSVWHAHYIIGVYQAAGAWLCAGGFAKDTRGVGDLDENPGAYGAAGCKECAGDAASRDARGSFWAAALGSKAIAAHSSSSP